MAIETPEGYAAFDEASLIEHLAGDAVLRGRLGGAPASWKVSEVGDGNLNLVFIVEGPSGDVCVKQALPYVRLVGEGWPLPLERAFFEYRATTLHSEHVPGRMPEILHYDPRLYAIVMERLSPHVIMRRGMIDGIVYEKFADHVTDYLAATLFHTSDLFMKAADKKAAVATFCGNTELCKITEDLIFTDPYVISSNNRWTSPQLDEDARAVREDTELKRAVARLKHQFLCKSEALLHGDMHTGSIMITPDDTRIIDPEFAFFGPIAFDVGKLIGNLLLAFFSQSGHEKVAGERDDYRAWILRTVEEVWNGFERKFVALWTSRGEGDAWPAAFFEGEDGRRSLELAQRAFMRALFEDALGFAGCSMIRRTLGLAHNIDMEWIEDPDRRAACERQNLAMAKELIKQAAGFADIAAVTARARG
ncbi:MAG: S-methyl-5-thioribose kinase [Geminicoccaceae bacterium]|nr:S-methyl-5-thioribose kinase [Geminicoccaceae bacterium]